MPNPRPDDDRPALPDGRGVSALVLGGLGSLLVAVAVGLAVASSPDLKGLVLVVVGLAFALAGLVQGIGSAVRGRRDGDRAAIAGAGLSVLGLAGGLVWIAAFVLTVLAGPIQAGLVPAGTASVSVCVPGCDTPPGTGRSAP